MSAERSEQMKRFLESAGWGGATLLPIEGDASSRRYIRLKANGHSAILMDQPQHAESATAPVDASPEERRALGYNAVARLAGADCARFAAASNYLRGLGLSAPAIHALDAEHGFAVIEDLGDDLYASVIPAGADERALYAAAAEVLATLHAAAAPAVLPPDKTLHAYDETALLAEIDLLPEWYYPVALGREASEAEIAEHRALWKRTLAPALSSPPVFVHRDFHAQNLMWLPDRHAAARVGLIDFQDAVSGNHAYDLVSLIEDARRDVPPEIADATAKHYLAAMRRQGTPLDEPRFREQMAVMAAQRNAKIAGIFSRLFKRDGKPRYLEMLPRVWGYLNHDLQNPALGDLKRWYDRTIPPDIRGSSRPRATP